MHWVFMSSIVFCNLKFLLGSCLCIILFGWGFTFLCWEFLNCFICFKCVRHWTHWNIFMMVTSKSFSDNYCVCVISVLGSIVCLFLVKFRFFWSCYDKWPLIKTWKFWILYCKTLDLIYNVRFSRSPLTLLLWERGGAASLGPGGWGSPSPPLGLGWHILRERVEAQVSRWGLTNVTLADRGMGSFPFPLLSLWGEMAFSHWPAVKALSG